MLQMKRLSILFFNLMVKIFKIKGDSLYPFLKDTQRVFCIKPFWFIKLKLNDFVVFEKKGYGLMVKQIKSIQKENYFVKGTDVHSIDSRDFGTIHKTQIKYKLLF